MVPEWGEPPACAGPAGVFEMEAFSKGTFAIAKTLAEITKKVGAHCTLRRMSPAWRRAHQIRAPAGEDESRQEPGTRATRHLRAQH